MTDPAGWGVQREYHDAAGAVIRADDGTVAAALAAIGDDEVDGPPPPLILHPGDTLDHPLEVVTEDGRHLDLRGNVGDLPLGYHTCHDATGERTLVVSPGRCHLPPGLRLGGWAVQVYAARSAASWGIGDLADLRTLGGWAAAAGAGFALVNPLSAAAPSLPVEASPYLPTSRRWRNPLYLRVEEVPGARRLGAALDPLAAAGRALNTDRHIDRDAVLALKLDALHRIHAASRPSRAFRSWRATQGDDLERFATFAALAEHHGGDFREWPAELRDPAGPAVTAARGAAADRVTFHAWLQWLLDDQLARAAAALPLMADLPIGVDPGGADVWADPELFATGFSVGAPPDLFNTLGQDWAQPPWNPRRLRARGYAPLVATLRAGFAHAMGLRIDHVMGLFRLYWIPRGEPASSGVYVRYPYADLLDVLALESVRAGAVVVGEDLGTVEPVVREQMAARDILAYRLLWFEDGPPSTYPQRAMSAVTTHDLPTVAGLWTGADLEAQRAIGLPVNEPGTAGTRDRLARAADRTGGDGGGDDDVAGVIADAYAALAASPSMLVAAALEDADEVVERPNMPGTVAPRWPNWSLALPHPLEELTASPLAQRLARTIGER